MRRVELFFCAILVAGLVACSGGGVAPCGDNAAVIEGECVVTTVCGPGTTQRDLECLPADSATCGTGTREVDGECVPDTGVVCGEGTVEEDGGCVPEEGLQCGAGTTLVDGSCLPSESLVCGTGTVLDESGDDPVCELRCAPPEVFDPGEDDCVSECGPGSALNDDSGICEAQCDTDSFYDAETDGCLTVPECGRDAGENTDNNECEGYPFDDLSLETLCARRAFNVCATYLDCCGDAGLLDRYLRSLANKIDKSGPSLSLPDIAADMATCETLEMWSCEMNGAAQGREWVAQGMVGVDPEGLEAFDQFFEDLSCSVPVGEGLFPQDLMQDVVVPLVELDGTCEANFMCKGDAYCHSERTDVGTVRTCRARVAVDEDCLSIGGPEGNCQEDLRCLLVPDVGYKCRARLAENDSCGGVEDMTYEDFGCEEGLFCRPEVYGDESPLKCLPPITAADETCRVANYTWEQDWCGPDTYCDTNGVPGNASHGFCAAALAADSGCTARYQRSFSQLASETGNSVCLDDLLCSIQPNLAGDGYDQVCAAEESTCHYLLGICELTDLIGEECED